MGVEQEPDPDQDDSNDEDFMNMNERNHKIYNNVTMLRNEINAHCPISVTILKNGMVGCFLKSSSIIKLICQDFHGWVLSHAYHHWSIGPTHDTSTWNATNI